MKTRYLICCVLIVLAALSAPASADIPGDVNNDGRITTEDSLLALAMAVGSVAPEMEHADVNADGRANSLDALTILMMAEKTQVCVNAPEAVSGAFEVTIEIYNVNDLNCGSLVIRVTQPGKSCIQRVPLEVKIYALEQMFDV